MNTSISQKLISIKQTHLPIRYRRMGLPLLLGVLLLNQQTRSLTFSVMSDAFWQVAVFVAATLALYHWLSAKLTGVSDKHKKWLSSPRGQVIFASLMGAIPGCGGAIIVITQYVAGSMRFGSVVAVLTSTMGDAAFLLIASQPSTGIGVIAMSVMVGIISGLVVDSIHDEDFLMSKEEQRETPSHRGKVEPSAIGYPIHFQSKIWRWLMLPGAAVGLLMAAQVDVAGILGVAEQSVQMLGASVVFILVTLWATSGEVKDFKSLVSEDHKPLSSLLWQKVALDTNFVTAWVILAFLIFELLLFYTALDLKAIFSENASILPMMGVLIGMIPGCGPQIITTSLYLNGSIPLSAQLGNAISNDGDALFPALALSPKVAVWATLYSTIPALIVAYGYFWLFE